MSYKVQKGDGWYRIAKRQGVNINDLLKANNATLDTLIHPGQMLKMPNQTTSQKSTTSKPTESYLSRKLKAIHTEEPLVYGYGTPQKANLVAKKGSLTDIHTKQAALVAAGYNLGKSGINKDGVDGAWGDKSKAAWNQAMQDGYVYENGRLVKPNTEKSEKSKRSSTASYQYATNPMFGTPVNIPRSNTAGVHGTSNNPINAAVEDLAVSSINNVYRWITGNDDYIISSRDITELPEDQKQVLRQFYNSKGGKGNIPWTTADYKKYQGTYTGGNRSLSERAFTPAGAVEHTLGQLNFVQDPNTGDVYMTDTYDWNTGESSQNQGWYTKARDFMGKFGTKDSDPEGQKRHYKVNLGNPKNWKL